MPAVVCGRLAFQYQPHNTCVSKCLAIHHIQVFLPPRFAFMQLPDIIHTTMECLFLSLPSWPILWKCCDTHKKMILSKKLHLLVFSWSLIYGLLLAIYRLMTYTEIVHHKCLLLLRKSIRSKKVQETILIIHQNHEKGREETQEVKSQTNKPSHCGSECRFCANKQTRDLQALLSMRGATVARSAGGRKIGLPPEMCR